VGRVGKSGRTPGQGIRGGGEDHFGAGGGGQVAVVGESNLLVVISEGKVLVLKRGHGQDVKRITSGE